MKPGEARILLVTAPRLLPALLAFLALVLLSPQVAALHEPPLRVSLTDGVKVEVAPVDRTLRHVLDDAVDQAAAPLRPAPAAPAPAAPATAGSGPSPLPQALAAMPAWVPLAAGLLLAVLGVALLAAALARRRARRERAARTDRERELRERAELSRLCADASAVRAVRLLESNARLRDALAKGGPHAAKPA